MNKYWSAGVAFCIACATSIAAGAAELPVKKVILYKHGIGFFERGGEIPAGESARLDFKAGEMNDVLKSLVVGDATGNTVAGVRYDSSQPLTNKLREFPFVLREKAPLVDLLDQMKGAEIELKLVAGNVVKGRILGARVLANQKADTDVESLSVLTAEGAMASFDLSAVASLNLQNPELQRQLAEYLSALNVARSREQKSVYIDSSRDAARSLRVAYTIPMPVWKSSYRLVLDSGAQKKTMLEGWAIVDNTTNEDWTKVDLSLVSGRPISFISKLYEPKLVQREVAELAEEKARGPVVYRGVAGGIAGGVPGGMGGFMDQRAKINAAPPPAPMAQSMMAEISEVNVDTATREAGELFEYKFGQPITVKRNESAMLPFVQQEIAGRKLLIYTQGSGSEHPLNSVELTNSTGKTLDGGPLSVYDGGIYAGEALVNTFKAGDKRLLSYAEDLGTRVVERGKDGPRNVRSMTAARGVVTTRFVQQLTKTYEIRNVDKKAKTLVVEHPLVEGRTLQTPKPAEKAVEKTATHYRFEVKLSGAENESLQVEEQEVMEETQSLSSWKSEDFVGLSTNGALSPAARQFFAEISKLRQAQADADEKIKQLNQQIQESGADVERLRRNLSSLNNVTGQQERVQRYAAELAKLDEQISGLRAEASAETKRRDDLRRQVQTKLESANF
ncbi:MAG: DUF4139 domain-containing protein [Bryobacter sp.]|nr:DUF4139 domain-containing protein [Bryobacter sp.]